jgi:hypothetical protein
MCTARSGAALCDMVAFDGFKLVDKTGNIAKPDGYRDRYQMLGAYTVIDPKGNQMHFIYALPGASRNEPLSPFARYEEEVLDMSKVEQNEISVLGRRTSQE